MSRCNRCYWEDICEDKCRGFRFCDIDEANEPPEEMECAGCGALVPTETLDDGLCHECKAREKRDIKID